MKLSKKGTILFRLSYLIIFLILVVVLMREMINSGMEPDKKPVGIVKPVPNQFGFVDDSLNKYTDMVKRNETLSDILEPFNVRNTSALEIALASRDTFDVRKIRAGKFYHIYTSNDSLQSVEYFIYEKDPVNFIVFDLTDSLKVYTGRKDVEIKERTKSALIKTSLYDALMESNASIDLAIRLSQIYAWQIDFYRLQKGDYFKVIYEEEFVDSQMVGIGKVLGAYFYHNGKDFFAIPFVQDSVYEFFDENGNSLQKEFLKTPIEFARISSRFSSHRYHPVLHKYRPHYGVDYAAPTGTPIRTVGDGVVMAAAYGNGNGKYVKIRHNSVYTTMYLHMSRFAKGIKKGAKVKQGQVIGYVGSTGLATGPHLDFRFYVNGSPVDPLKVEIPPSHPVKDELKNEFEKKKQLVLDELEKIKVEGLNPPV